MRAPLLESPQCQSSKVQPLERIKIRTDFLCLKICVVVFFPKSSLTYNTDRTEKNTEIYFAAREL